MAIITGTVNNDTLNGTNKDDTIYGGSGSDTIHGMQGDDKVVGEQEDLIYSNIAGVVNIPAPVVFGGDNLYGDQGNDSLYGDLVNLSFTVKAGTDANQTLGGASLASPITLAFGNDALDGGVGNDLLVGDVDSILLRAEGGNTVVALPVSSASAFLQYITLNMGADTLTGGAGADILYGDTRIMTLEAFGGIANDPTPGSQSASAIIQGIKYFGGSDYLYGGYDNDLLVGDIGTLNILSQGGYSFGTGDNATARVGPITADSVLTMGNDHLWGDQGTDVLYGDINNFDLTVIGGTVNGGNSAQGQLFGITLNMGADELHGGAGNDAIYGDIGSFVLVGQGGLSISGASASALIQPSAFSPLTFPIIFNMGSDQLYGDEGNDRLVGDIGTLSILGTGGIIDTAGLTGAQFAVIFHMGADYLSGGNGDDILYGDTENFSAMGKGITVSGDGAGSYAEIGGTFTMGDDILLGGLGNDVLYGDSGSFTYDMKSGNIDSTSTSPTADAAAASAIDKLGADFSFQYILGSDMLSGNSGDDILYGDMGTLNLSLTAGTNDGASTKQYAVNSLFWDSNITMGNDILEGGSGNDHLYGDLGSASVVLTDGTGIGSINQINNSTIKFGNDTLIGGSGDDVLVGDISDPTQLAKFLSAPNSSAPDYPAIPNQLIFGNDTFVFSLDGMNGNDTILDMNVGAVSTATCTVTNAMDTLKFTGVKDVNHDSVLDFHDVDAVSAFSNNAGHLMMSFAGGSINFANIAFAGQTSVHDITPNIVVVA